MKIFIDIGNSRFKSARFEDGKLSALETIPWRDADVEEQLDIVWKDLVPEQIVVCNVAGERVFPQLESWCEKNLDIMPVQIRSTASFRELRNGYREPEKLGADRWAAMIGARAEYEGALCVIDSGTATTVDIIREDGEHRGGAILPGIYTMRQSLGKYTAALFAATGDIKPFSNNTGSGIAGGTGYASVGAIDRLIDEARDTIGEITTIFTGGEASVVRPLLRNPTVLDSMLVIKGVQQIAEHLDQGGST